MSAYRVSFWTESATPTKTSTVVLADSAADAVAAVQATMPVRHIFETRGAHFGLDAADAMTLCRCGHPAKDHTTGELTGDECSHVGYGHHDGARASMHPCSCQGFWAADMKEVATTTS